MDGANCCRECFSHSTLSCKLVCRGLTALLGFNLRLYFFWSGLVYIATALYAYLILEYFMFIDCPQELIDLRDCPVMCSEHKVTEAILRSLMLNSFSSPIAQSTEMLDLYYLGSPSFAFLSAKSNRRGSRRLYMGTSQKNEDIYGDGGRLMQPVDVPASNSNNSVNYNTSSSKSLAMKTLHYPAASTANEEHWQTNYMSADPGHSVAFALPSDNIFAAVVPPYRGFDSSASLSSSQNSGGNTLVRTKCNIDCPLQLDVVALCAVFWIQGGIALIVAICFWYFEQRGDDSVERLTWCEWILGFFVKTLPPIVKILLVPVLIQISVLWCFYAVPELGSECAHSANILSIASLVTIVFVSQISFGVITQRHTKPPPWLYRPEPQGDRRSNLLETISTVFPLTWPLIKLFISFIG